MYVSSWVLKFHARHLRTLAVCLTFHVLVASFKLLTFPPSVLSPFVMFQRLIGLIAEVTSASELNPGMKYPFIGEGCENLARKLSAAFESKSYSRLKLFVPY